ncbi:hypothetical protein EV183_003640 [Coemansia sp. RSA 2336]|nr:hypothetical protein EV183_003640 [Coemansia sp. RSA 2336]
MRCWRWWHTLGILAGLTIVDAQTELHLATAVPNASECSSPASASATENEQVSPDRVDSSLLAELYTTTGSQQPASYQLAMQSVSNEPTPTAHQSAADSVADESLSSTEEPGHSTHRDARSLKERFNYASGDCAAVVLKANREARGTTAILNSKKDQYMLNECSAPNKHVVVELCDDILIDTFVLGNYEFFSSTFKDIMVYASDRYPPKDNQWTFIGHFQGTNSRDAQVFPVRDPKIWAKYILIEFTTHYGREFYCPLTVFKVYGATQMEQYRKEEEEEDMQEPATLTVDALAGIPLLEYHWPYYRQQQQQQRRNRQREQPLRIAGSVSPAKAYLQDMQGLINEYQMQDKQEPRSESKAASMPRVPDLPWDQEGNDEEDYEEEEDEDEGRDIGDAQHIRSDDSFDGQVARDVGSTRNTENKAHEPTVQTQQRQESIFKTIMRRLLRVERNVTLAYRYLEEQHMVFNLVLQQVEMNNLETMQLAIDKLNRTTASQMQSLTTLSEEVWRAILYDLEEYQQKTQAEMSEMGSRLEFLAQEVLFEKRMNVAQLVLLLTIVIMIAPLAKGFKGLKIEPKAGSERPIRPSAFESEDSTDTTNVEMAIVEAQGDRILGQGEKDPSKLLVIPAKENTDWMKRTLREEAIDELVGNGSSSASRRVIPTGLNEDDLDDVDDDAYDRVPIEEFGAAMLRGMGWKGDDSKPSTEDTKPRPSLLGLGATPLRKD